MKIDQLVVVLGTGLARLIPLDRDVFGRDIVSNKDGYLLVNLGSPSAPTTKAVRKYLSQFLRDRRVIPLNPWLWWPILFGLILRTRPAQSAKAYASVWDRDEDGEFEPNSALIDITYQQANALRGFLSKHHGGEGKAIPKVEIAMRYGQPSIDLGIQLLRDQGCDNIRVLPLYPQMCKATTLSVYDGVKMALANIEKSGGPVESVGAPELKLQCLGAYACHPEYIGALKNSLESHLKNLDWDADQILISFHGMPKSATEQGDPYEGQCQASFTALQQAMPKYADKMALTYQSRFGPKAWLGPYTSHTLLECAEAGRKNIVILAPGFAADCLETLEELSISEKNRFLDHGGKNYSVVPCLNDDPNHIKLIYNLLQNKDENLLGQDL